MEEHEEGDLDRRLGVGDDDDESVDPSRKQAVIVLIVVFLSSGLEGEYF